MPRLEEASHTTNQSTGEASLHGQGREVAFGFEFWFVFAFEVRAAARFICACCVASLLGCASSGGREAGTRFGLESEDAYANSQASGHAYGADAFTFRKTMKIRPPNDFHFYFKHCELSDQPAFYSKTSYWCSEP